MLVRKTVWVARDKDTRLWMYSTEPERGLDLWEFTDDACNAFELPSTWFPNLTWKDKPKKMKFGLKQKTDDDKFTDNVENILNGNKITFGDINEST